MSLADVQAMKALKLAKQANNQLVTSFDEFPGKNLYNPSKNVEGKYIHSSTGVTTSDVNYFYTTISNLKQGSVLTFSRLSGGGSRVTCTARHISAYDATNNFITQATGVAQNVATYTVPAGVDHITLSFITSYLTNSLQVEINASGSITTYEPYKPIYSLKSNLSSPLSGKKLAMDGDSVFYGHLLGPSVNPGAIISGTYGMALNNRAVNGGTIASGTYNSGTPRHWVCESVPLFDADSDYMIVEGGYNDLRNDVPLGTLKTTYSSDTLDTTTFYGGLESIFRTLTQTFKGKKAGFVIVHKTPNSITTNALGLTFENYKQAIILTCEKYGIPYLNLYNLAPITMFYEDNVNNAIYTQQGQGNIHPNELGYKTFYVPKIVPWLEAL